MTLEARAVPRFMTALLESQGEAALERNVQSVRVVLVDGQGRAAEVQVAVSNGGLVIIAAGDCSLDRDARGFARVRVDPS